MHSFLYVEAEGLCSLSYFTCKPFVPLAGNAHQGVSIQILPFTVYNISCLHFNLVLSRFSVVLKAGNKYVPAWSGNM